ncbi:MAG TPA: hypothetical protein VEA38_07600 [Terriglobales bacterium]|nr:hypothetical protein [Terriglobales bacterium]
MAKDPREQQKTDAERIGEQGTGKLDDTKEKDAVVRQRAEQGDDADDAAH